MIAETGHYALILALGVAHGSDGSAALSATRSNDLTA